MRIYDNNSLKRVARECGSYYFEPETMRHFDSRLIDVEPTSADTLSGYFLTSERDKWSDGPRVYNVREYAITTHEHTDGTRCHTFDAGTVETHDTLKRARTALRKRAEVERQS